MGFVPTLFKKASFFIGILFLSFSVSSSFASTKILVWGDSLSAAYGIPVEKGWVHLLKGELGDGFEIVNGSISGETTQGGLTRFPAALKNHKPNFVILELGANDGLRGISPQVSKRNLKKMIEQAKHAKAQVLLFGMKIPPNYGVVFAEQFEAQFADLANDFELPFIPFFLESIINDLDYFQQDELHPTAEAQVVILKSILPRIKKALENTSSKPDKDIKEPA